MAINLPHVKTSLGAVRPHTGQVAEEIANRWLLYFVWGIGDTGEHKAGRALDFMTYDDGSVAHPGPRRDKIGAAIADYLVANHDRLGIWYVIWDRHIWSINFPLTGWRPYNGTNPHVDHVHVSFISEPPAYRPPGDDDMGNADQVLAAVSALSDKTQKQYAALLKNQQQEDPRWHELFQRLDELEIAVKALKP